MSTESERNAAALERLSALVDGELDTASVAQACGLWRESVDVRASWHAYHVIGDVLRSDDLASDPARDAAFLQALRGRLDVEPVVLAPQPLVAATGAIGARFGNGAASSGRWSWMAPSAVAAGFVAVAGVLMLTRGPGAAVDASTAPSVAQVAPAAATPSVELASASTLAGPMLVASEPQPLPASGKVIRDVRLDRYLAAHKQFAGSSALGVPSGFLRNATATEADR